MTSGGLIAVKARARDAAMARREGLKGKVGEAPAIAALLEELGGDDPRPVSGFLPIGSEIDPRPAMEELARTRPVCVPVLQGMRRPLLFREWTPGCTLIAGPYNVAIPAEGDYLVPGTLIVPLLAFDGACYRLGYGGGFYDRTLDMLREISQVRAIGLAFSEQQIEEVPRDATDQRLDAIVTERGVIRPAAESGLPDAAVPPRH